MHASLVGRSPAPTGSGAGEANVAILIDYENVGLDTLATLFDQVSDVGRVIVKRAYGDWSQAGKNAQEQLLELGIEAIQNFHAAGSAKNSSDIRLAIDAVDLLYNSPVQVFVIVSADSDFVPLVSKLRAGGKDVIGAGRRAVVSPTLVKSCDRYVFLDRSEPQSIGSQSTVQAASQSLVLRALSASKDEDGKVVAAKLHQTMLRIEPGFDFRALGFKTFTQFLQGCPGVRVEKPKKGGDVVVEET